MALLCGWRSVAEKVAIVRVDIRKISLEYLRGGKACKLRKLDFKVMINQKVDPLCQLFALTTKTCRRQRGGHSYLSAVVRSKIKISY